MRVKIALLCLTWASPAQSEIIIAFTTTPWKSALVTPAFGPTYDTALVGDWRMVTLDDQDRPGGAFRVTPHGSFTLDYSGADAPTLCAMRTQAEGGVDGLYRHAAPAPDPDGFLALAVSADREGMDLPQLRCGQTTLTGALAPAFGLMPGPYRYRIDPAQDHLTIDMPGEPGPSRFVFERAAPPLDTPPGE